MVNFKQVSFKDHGMRFISAVLDSFDQVYLMINFVSGSQLWGPTMRSHRDSHDNSKTESYIAKIHTVVETYESKLGQILVKYSLSRQKVLE